MSIPHPMFAFTRVFAALATLLISIASNEAHALQFHVTELSCVPNEWGTCYGADITVGIRVEADPGEEIYGLGASAFGYNESVVDFVYGTTIPSIFHGVALPGIGAFNGLSNVLINPLTETSIGSNGNRVLFFNGVGLSPVRYNPLDPGLDGVIGGGDTQFRLIFRIGGPGESIVTIGTGYEGDGAVYAGGRLDQSSNVSIYINSEGLPYVIPEPSAALLIGVGLAGLAGRKQQDARRARQGPLRS